MENLKKSASKLREENPLITKVFLFGSFVKGNYTPDSDVDILIIIKQIDTPFLKRAELFRDFFRNIPFELNLLIYSVDEMKKMIEEKNLFIQNVMQNAKEF